MGGEAVANAGLIPKPVLRGLHNASIARNLIVSGVLMTIAFVSIRYLRNEPKKQDYRDFYKTYDAEKSFKRMVDAGLMHSCKEI